MADKDNIPATEFEKWNLLPPEMKRECIKTMDFQTRWQLRGASKTEKALVDSLKIIDEIHWLIIYSDAIFFSFSHIDDASLDNFSLQSRDFSEEKFNEKLISFMLYALPKCKVGAFIVENSIGAPMRPILDRINEQTASEIYRVDRFDFEGGTKEDFEVFSLVLKKSWTHVTDIVIDVCDIHVISIDEIFRIPALINLKGTLLIANAINDQILPILQKWTENDMRIGSKFQINIGETDLTIHKICSILENRKISFSDGILRIHTENPEKHILIVSRETEHWAHFGGAVIPADLDESDFVDHLDFLEA